MSGLVFALDHAVFVLPSCIITAVRQNERLRSLPVCRERYKRDLCS